MVGVLIGFERKKAGKPTWIRTLSLVCVGATFIMIAGLRNSIKIGEIKI